MDKIIDLISVVVPYHNAEKTLKDCIGSILSQTYSNIEVICVNDGSEDDSVSYEHILHLSQKKGAFRSLL